MSAAQPRLVVVAAVLVLAAALLLQPVRALGAIAAPGLTITSVAPDSGLQNLFDTYGNTGGGWTGADSTYSAALPGGRDAWIFSDTFLGTVNADGSRPAGAPFIHNSIVVQQRGQLRTVSGGTPQLPQSLFGPTPSGPPTDPSTQNADWYWSGDGIVEDGVLLVFALHFHSTGTGAFDFAWQNDSIATFSLPSLRLLSLTPTYSAGDVTWGSWLMDEGPWTYVYGVEDLGSVKYLHLARAPRGGLLGRWQFWTGSAWSSDPSSSARLLGGIGNEFSVTRQGARLVLVTFDTTVPFGNQIVAYTAGSPAGPFTGKTDVYAAPQASGNVYAYNAHAHPELGSANRMVISYNVNSLQLSDVYTNVQNYRPRFLDVTLGA
ncbi:MAG: DUF5005 domain-containing protein [Candidatus Dormibacteraceae bacterium]